MDVDEIIQRGQRLRERLTELKPTLGPDQIMFAEYDKDFRNTGEVIIVTTLGELVPVGTDLALPAELKIDRGATTIEVRTSMTELRKTVTIRDVSDGMLRRLHLDHVVAQSIEAAMVTTVERPAWDPSPTLDASGNKLTAEQIAEWQAQIAEWNDAPLPAGSRFYDRRVVRRILKAKITETDVRRAADAYRAGGIEEVKKALIVEDRQAWRYVQKAQQLGLVPRQRAPKRDAK